MLSKWGFKWWALCAAMLVGLFLIGWGLWSTQAIFPAQWGSHLENDQIDGGTSKIWTKNLASGQVEIHWFYGSGFGYPYSRMKWSVNDSAGSCPYLDHVRKIDLTFKSPQSLSFAIELREFLPGWSNLNDANTLRPRLARLWGDGGVEKHVQVPFEQLSVPDWWFTDAPNSPHENLNAIRVCQIGLTLSGKAGQTGFVTLKELKLVGDTRVFWLGIFVSSLTFIAFMYFGFQSMQRSRVELAQLKSRLDLQSKIKNVPLVVDRDWQNIQAQIEAHWNQSELQMNTLVENTGLPGHRIAALIKEKAGVNFKVLLNQIRLERAEKMLLETREQVAQIAIQCGYGNVAHFYRVFKQKNGVNPGDWREMAQKSAP